MILDLEATIEMIEDDAWRFHHEGNEAVAQYAYAIAQRLREQLAGLRDG